MFKTALKTITGRGGAGSQQAAAPDGPDGPGGQASGSQVQMAQHSRAGTSSALDRAERGQAHQVQAEPALHIDCRPTRRGASVRVRADAQAGLAAHKLAELLARLRKSRPPEHSSVNLDARGPHMQGTLVLYKALPQSNPLQARCEAYYTSIPGVMLAALGVVAQPGDQALAGHAMAQALGALLGAPPISLATGVWTGQDGTSYLLHNNHLHRAAPAAGGQLSAWQDITPLGATQNPAARLRMWGAQADGSVLVRNGSQLLRLGTPHGALQAIELPRLQGLAHDAPMSLDGDGTLHVLTQGMLHSMRPTAHAAAARELRLMRAGPGGQAEESPAQPRQLLMQGRGAHLSALVVDTRGRLYEASLSNTPASAPVLAHRLAWPAVLGPSAQWAVTAAGLSPQGPAQVLIEHKEGRCVSLQQTQPGGPWELQFDMDQPLLLVGQQGLVSPNEAQLQDSVHTLDGHARLALHNGTAFYSPSPEHAWVELQDAAGQALSGVLRLGVSPFGFVDRKPVVALRQVHDQLEVIALRLQGRTTLLPAKPPAESLAGGPLAVVPARVSAAPRTLGLLPAAGTPRSLACDKDGHVFVLQDSGAGQMALFTNHPMAAAQGDALAPLPLPPGVQTLALALAGDNRLHVLCAQNQQRQLQGLQADGSWQVLPLALELPNDGQAPALASDLRTSRHGTLEVCMTPRSANEPPRWHAVLPGITRQPDGQWAPGRLDPQGSHSDQVSAGMHAGTNQSVDQQGAMRVAMGGGAVRVDTTLLGNRSTDPALLTSNLRNLYHTTRGHLSAMAGQVSNTVSTSYAWATGQAMQAAARQRILPLVAEASAVHGELRTWALRMSNTPTTSGGGAPRLRPAAVPAGAQAQATLNQLATLRRDELERMLGNVQKIAIRAGVLSPDLRRNPSHNTGTTLTYRLEQGLIGLARQAVDAVGSLLGHTDEDMLPVLQTFWNQVDTPALAEDERQLVEGIRSVLTDLRAGGVVLPSNLGPLAGLGHADERVPDDQHAIRTADAARASVTFERLLRANSPAEAQQLQSEVQASGLRQLARSGMSAWSEVEAFDRVLTDFRQAMADPHSPRRQQLLKSLGMPLDAAPDQMASRMAEMMQDLYNRSTFFSIETSSVGLSFGTKGPGMLKEAVAVTAGPTFETTHLLGVERIGDSLDDDAGLVAFFVEQSKQRVAVNGGVRIATKKGAGEKVQTDPDDHPLTSKIAWGGAISGRAQLTRLRGTGMALLVHRDQFADFARALLAPPQEPPRELCQLGYGGEGAIGLNLLEVNAEATISGAYNVGMPSVDVAHGEDQPRPPPRAPSSPSGAPPLLSPQRASPAMGDEGRLGYYTALPGEPPTPGAYAGAEPSTSARPPSRQNAAPAKQRGTFSFGVPTSGGVDAKASVQEMELHLDHAWAQILGLEFQGHVQFAVGGALGARLTAGETGAIGRLANQLTNLTTGVAGLQLASVNASLPEVRPPYTVTATYKRTLDAMAARPLSTENWQALQSLTAETFPRQQVTQINGAMPAQPSLQALALHDLIQTIEGHAQGAPAAFEGAALFAQRGWAQVQAMHAQNRGDVPVAASEVGRAKVLDTARQLLQQIEAAGQQRALVIPGARVEINTLGKVALDGVMRYVLGHVGLGGKMQELPQAIAAVPGLGAALSALRGIRMVDQVRFVFEMRPQAIAAINDALALKEAADAAVPDGAPAAQALAAQPELDWQTLLVKARSSADLYRLATIAVHNTDDNPTSAGYNLLGFSQSHTSSASHQLFSAELQLRYGPLDELVGVRMLESAGRAAQEQLRPLQAAGVAAVGRASQAGDPERYGPASPRVRRP